MMRGVDDSAGMRGLLERAPILLRRGKGCQRLRVWADLGAVAGRPRWIPVTDEPTLGRWTGGDLDEMADRFAGDGSRCSSRAVRGRGRLASGTRTGSRRLGAIRA